MNRSTARTTGAALVGIGLLCLGWVVLAGRAYSGTVQGEGAGIVRISMATDGTEANADSYPPVVSGNGRFIAFSSLASNLVPNDTNAMMDVFLYDRQSGTMSRVSVGSSGEQGNAGSGGNLGDAFTLALTPDGRYVAFGSGASNWVTNDYNETVDVYLRDRVAGTTELINVALNGIAATTLGGEPVDISSDGRFVTFSSLNHNIVPGDTNQAVDVFVRDRVQGTIERVSVASDGSEGGLYNESWNAVMSADGRYVAFLTRAPFGVGDDLPWTIDLYVRDRTLGITERASVPLGGAWLSGTVLHPGISNDGRYVVYSSDATNLVADDTNAANDIFVFDRTTGATERVSVATGGGQSNGSSYTPAISADGRFVTFWSLADNLVPLDRSNGDIFVHDRVTRRTTKLSLAASGSHSTLDARQFPSLSDDGSVVAFASADAILVPDDLNGASDVFVRPWHQYPPLQARYGFLPLALRGYPVTDEVCQSDETEPNHFFYLADSNLPLCEGQIAISTLPDGDTTDIYRIELSAESVVDIRLFEMVVGADYDLYLHDDDAQHTTLEDSTTNGSGDERITINLAAGRYYLRIVPHEHATPHTYRLRWARE